MLVACTLGRSFAIVSFAKALEPWFAEIVDWHGLSGRCAAIRTLDEAFRSIDDVQDEKEQVLVELANRTVSNDAADVVILAGAPLAGMAGKVKDRIAVPVVDGIQAAVTMAEGLVRLGPRKAIAGTYRRPAAKDSKGLATALANVIGHRELVTSGATAARRPIPSGRAARGSPCRSSSTSRKARRCRCPRAMR